MREEKEGVKKKKKKPTHLTQTVGQRKGKSRRRTVQNEWKIKVREKEEKFNEDKTERKRARESAESLN